MNPSDASRTALATSLMRAIHTRTAPAPLIDDSWGDRLVPEQVRATFLQLVRSRAGAGGAPVDAAALPDAAIEAGMRSTPAYAEVIVRARYTEDQLQAAVARGVSQYVLVGAGFDSFAWRRPAFAQQLDIYEVDHPATQGLKRQQLAANGVADSAKTHFVPADFTTESLAAALSRSPFDPDRPTFFSLLGVTPYLTREANLSTLRAIASCAPAGSELVFTYLDEAILDPNYAGAEAFRELKQQVAAVGEDFLSGFDPKALPAQLQAVGFELVEDVSGPQMVARYDAAGVNGLQSKPEAHIARARIVGV